MEYAMFYLLASIIILTYIYYRFTYDYNYWKKRGVPCAEGLIPGIGHLLPLMCIQKNLGTLSTQIYKIATEYSMVGFYLFSSPALLIRDPELVKSVLQTNFGSFAKNEMELDEKLEPLLYRNPFVNTGEAWKVGRTRLSSAFTSGKLRILSDTIKDVCHRYTLYLDEKVKKNKNVYDVEVKDSLRRLTGEIAAVTGFSIEGHCFEDSVLPRTFREITLMVFGDGLSDRLKFLGFLYCPSLIALFGIKFLPYKFEMFFEKVCRSNIESRKGGFAGMDFLQMMIHQEMKESTDLELVNKAVTSHMASFFVDMYETTSTTLAFVLHQLSCDQEIQEKVRQEVRDAVAKSGGNLTVDTIEDMPYMDQVINESMRLNPAIFSMTKVCTEKIELMGSDGLSCKMDPGTSVYIPVQALHLDPLYWENPKKFDPERFRPEVENARHKFVYLPFNEGPRSCPGRRIARVVMKMGLSMMLLKFSMELSPKMKMPLEYEVLSAITYSKSGLWVTMKPLPEKKVIG